LKGDPAQEMGGLDDPINTMGTGPEMNTLGMLSGLNPAAVGMWREGSEDSDLSGAESEGFGDDGIGFFDQQQQQHAMGVNASNTAATATADPMFIGVGASNVGGASGMSGGLGDIQMEDEISRGSEEGMMQQPHAHALQYATVAQNFASDSVLWTQHSPAFPSPSQQQQHVRHTNRSSISGSPVGMIARHHHSSSSSASSLSAFVGSGTGSGDEYGTSMSLPLYERPGMYTSSGGVIVAETGNATGVGTGAGSSTRRPRSMTPSLFGRSVEESGIRRPLSSVSSLNESGVNGNRSRGESGGGSERLSPVPMISSMNMGGGQRVYHHHQQQQRQQQQQQHHHPYVNSGESSTHSSPAVYTVSLRNVHSATGESVQQPPHPSQQHPHPHQQQQQQQDGIQRGGGLGRSESRTSFGDEQEMFGISQQHHPMASYHQHSHSHQHQHQQQPLTESPVPYTIELPQHQQPHWNSHHHHHHHHHRDVMNMVGVYDSSQQQ